jgi:hypothetical protein
MSDVIRFLESAAIRQPVGTQYGAIVSRLDANEEQKRALMDRDVETLTRLLGGRDTMCCMILGTDPNAH